jgi:hypothetical protein
VNRKPARGPRIGGRAAPRGGRARLTSRVTRDRERALRLNSKDSLAANETACVGSQATHIRWAVQRVNRAIRLAATASQATAASTHCARSARLESALDATQRLTNASLATAWVRLYCTSVRERGWKRESEDSARVGASSGTA